MSDHRKPKGELMRSHYDPTPIVEHEITSKSPLRSLTRAVPHTRSVKDKSKTKINVAVNEDMFRAQHLLIEEHDRTIKSLQTFKQHIEKGLKEGIFDKEENEWVDAELKRITDIKNSCQEELSKKEDLYLNSILKLENLLEQRRIAIENAEKESCVFEQCPRLLQQFAEKRANLMKLVEKGKQDLQIEQ